MTADDCSLRTGQFVRCLATPTAAATTTAAKTTTAAVTSTTAAATTTAAAAGSDPCLGPAGLQQQQRRRPRQQIDAPLRKK